MITSVIKEKKKAIQTYLALCKKVKKVNAFPKTQ